MRYTESFLRDGDKVLVVGDVERKKGRSPEFFKGDHHLLVTDMNEKQISGLYKRTGTILWIVIGFLSLMLVMACGAGALISLIGGGIAGMGLKLPKGPAKQEQIKLVAKPLPIN